MSIRGFNSSKDGIQGGSVRLEAALSLLDRLVDWEKRARDGADGGMQPSIEPARDLCRRLGSPQDRLRVVHVAGSKGKGSTASLIASALQVAGLRTALYTSPHVERVVERLRLAGTPVSAAALAAALERALEAREDAIEAGSAAQGATWFDVLTSAALLASAEAGAEIAVVECGLGGRLDSTNVVHGAVAVITNVYLEHTAILGATRAEIAAEKAGIIVPGARVVVGALSSEDEAARVVEEVAAACGARCVRVEFGAREPLGERNARLARAALGELPEAFPDLVGGRGIELGSEALRSAGLPGRAERRMRGATRVVLDGAHVPESLALMLRDLGRDPELASPPTVVFGAGREKDARGLLKALVSRVDRVLCTSVGDGLFRSAAELTGLARDLGLDSRAVPEPLAALDEAVRMAGSDGWVLVTGSLHLVGALRSRTGD